MSAPEQLLSYETPRRSARRRRTPYGLIFIGSHALASYAVALISFVVNAIAPGMSLDDRGIIFYLLSPVWAPVAMLGAILWTLAGEDGGWQAMATIVVPYTVMLYVTASWLVRRLDP